MEVYVRLNNDIDRDYAFQVSREDTARSKVSKLFAERPEPGLKIVLADVMVLRPTLFHKKQPVGYSKSMHPGYLTEGGCLIFDYDAGEAKYLEKLDEDKPLFDQLWPGQLIVPEWEYSRKNIIMFAAILLFWLYTDLPDCISPTPGICLTNQLSRLLLPVLENYLDNQKMASKLREEIQVGYSSVPAQWGFFTLHVLKLLLIVLFFKFGMANPLTFNPVKMWQLRNNDLSRKSNDVKATLKSIGWIGSKRAIFDDYQSNYYNYILKKYGGIVPTFRAGMIKIAANPGIPLQAGEGFQTPLDERFTGSTFKEMEDKGKFILSEEYFIELENILKEKLDEANGDIGLMNEEIKKFRRYGLYEPSDKIRNMVKKRRAVYEEQQALIKEKEKETLAAKKAK
ncbi:Gsf2p KNAG_0G00360 [Huiozyma naganishii CBS 8797]|uniref:Glucose-signaling factor 2 n=1 Tax=Huiozyma naganishii (strain ATCC MYA-139 / BCRC 22969 / CBS 8797 / KCTC 17520 / NBRC 10181 / NCYC 3082 / Yp74L-3) TaxID=1071383 RepID=J7RNG8_HUIN7|nr:hypothetical protein KNAG_0G00360 [Kazachstania naganishii CBS 8797]CCK71093.1 hypothetical protein KNAG_0G00360 [Kazachstania naganishii CBS 8797]